MTKSEHQTKKSLGRVRISRRIAGEGHGFMVVGEERFQVVMLDIGLCGMRIWAPKQIDYGKEVILEISETYGVEAYLCRVAFSQQADLGWQLGLEILEQDARLLVIQLT